MTPAEPVEPFFQGEAMLTKPQSPKRYSVPSGSAAPGAAAEALPPIAPVRKAIRSVFTSKLWSVKVKSGSCGTMSTTSRFPTSRIVSVATLTLPSPACWMRSMTLLAPMWRRSPARMLIFLWSPFGQGGDRQETSGQKSPVPVRFSRLGHRVREAQQNPLLVR